MCSPCVDEEAKMVFPQLVLHARRHQIRLIRLVRQKSSHASLSASSCAQLQASSHALSKAQWIPGHLRGPEGARSSTALQAFWSFPSVFEGVLLAQCFGNAFKAYPDTNLDLMSRQASAREFGEWS